jgi:hypothetical protein
MIVAGIWPVEAFARVGIKYEQSAAPKSDLYRDLLLLINSQRIELLDHSRLINQLTALERRTARGGRDSIDHPPGAHDDLANVVAGVAAVNNKFGGFDTTYSWVDGNGPADPHGAEANAWWRRLQFDRYLRSQGMP